MRGDGVAVGVTGAPGGGHWSRAGRSMGDRAAEHLWESFLGAVGCALSTFRGSEGPCCTLNLPMGRVKAPVEIDFNFYLLETGCLFY